MKALNRYEQKCLDRIKNCKDYDSAHLEIAKAIFTDTISHDGFIVLMKYFKANFKKG